MTGVSLPGEAGGGDVRRMHAVHMRTRNCVANGARGRQARGTCCRTHAPPSRSVRPMQPACVLPMASRFRCVAQSLTLNSAGSWVPGASACRMNTTEPRALVSAEMPLGRPVESSVDGHVSVSARERKTALTITIKMPTPNVRDSQDRQNDRRPTDYVNARWIGRRDVHGQV